MEFMSHLAIDGEHLEIASTLARRDPSATVRVEAIRTLAWMRQREEVAELLRSLPDAEFAQAIERTDLGELPLQLRDRALAIYNTRLAASDDPDARFRLAFTLAEQGDPGGATHLMHELSNLPAALVQELSKYSLRGAIEILRRSDAQWVSEWVAAWIVDGALWEDAWLPFVSEVPQSLRQEWFRRMATEEIQQGGVVGVLAVTADAAFAHRAFAALRDQRRAVEADPRNEHQHALERQLAGLVRRIAPPILVEGLSTMLAADPLDEDLDVVVSVFGDSQDPNERVAPLPEASRDQLRGYLK